MIVVIDTNCLLASIPPQSSHYWLYLAFKERKFDWLISNEIMAEYEEQLSNRYSVKTADLVLNIMSVAPNVIFNEPYFRWNLISIDTDDNKFVDLAIASNADYLVTNDRHFEPLKSISFPQIAIVNMSEFKQIIMDSN